MRQYIIALDFDGTIVTHEYPEIGFELPFANKTLYALGANGHKIFLYTMRDGEQLTEAIDYIRENELPITLFNESPEQFSTSPKQYAHIYIDDAALGCPLLYEPKFSQRPFVNWKEIATMLTHRGLLTFDQLGEILGRNV